MKVVLICIPQRIYSPFNLFDLRSEYSRMLEHIQLQAHTKSAIHCTFAALDFFSR